MKPKNTLNSEIVVGGSQDLTASTLLDSIFTVPLAITKPQNVISGYSKSAFLLVGYEPIFLQKFEYNLYMLFVFFERITENNDIVKLYSNERKMAQRPLHQSFESGWCVRQSHRHYQPFI